jgi:hypothetical protein
MTRNQYFSERRQICYEIILRRKLEIGKCECGRCNHTVTLDNHHHFDFDHIDPTTKMRIGRVRVGVAHFARWGWISKLKQELPKCRLLHTTCHRDWTREQRKQGLDFPALKVEWSLFEQPYDLAAIQREEEEREGEAFAHFGLSCWRKEGGWAVLRDHNLEFLSCIRISDGKMYGWYPTVGFYEDTGPYSLQRAIMNTN